MPKLQISCNTQVRDGMIVHTEDPEVALTRRGVLELLADEPSARLPDLRQGRRVLVAELHDAVQQPLCADARTAPQAGKRIDIGEQMLLDQERCILCRRCVRFCREISKTGGTGGLQAAVITPCSTSTAITGSIMTTRCAPRTSARSARSRPRISITSCASGFSKRPPASVPDAPTAATSWRPATATGSGA